MAVWIIKAITQKTISFLPFKHDINFFFQKYVTKGITLNDALFNTKLTHCRQHMTAHKNFGNAKESFVCMELGTGWYPIVPIGLYLCGAKKIYSADIKMVINEKRVKETISKFILFHDLNLLENIFPYYNPKLIDNLKNMLSLNLDLNQLLFSLKMEVLIGDLTERHPISIEKIDLLHSNNTLEHIPQDSIVKIFNYFSKVINIEDGVASHFIDLSDHFSHIDGNISPYNFLRYSESIWQIINNNIQPQNRLRICEYLKIFENCGWKVLNVESTVSKIHKIDNQKIHHSKSNLTKSCLEVTHSLITLKLQA